MAFVQFVIITYSLAIDNLGILKPIFPSMWIWAIFFISVYIPAAVIIGHLHRRHQLPTESIQNTLANPYTYQAQPGKEILYSLYITRIGYDLQLRNMELFNSMADAISQATGKPVPKWSKEDFDLVEETKYITERLEKGENIYDIHRDLQQKRKDQMHELPKGSQQTPL